MHKGSPSEWTSNISWILLGIVFSVLGNITLFVRFVTVATSKLAVLAGKSSCTDLFYFADKVRNTQILKLVWRIV